MIYLFCEVRPLIESDSQRVILNYLERLPTSFCPVRKRMIKRVGDIFDFCVKYSLPVKFSRSCDGEIMIRRLKKSEIPIDSRVRVFVKQHGPVLESMTANKLKIDPFEAHDVVESLWRQGFIQYSYGKNGGLILTYKKPG